MGSEYQLDYDQRGDVRSKSKQYDVWSLNQMEKNDLLAEGASTEDQIIGDTRREMTYVLRK